MVETRPPIQPEAPRPSYDTPMTRLQPTVAASLQQAIAALPPPRADDEDEATVNEGEACKNNGCKLTFSADRVQNECVHHPGIPVFHEGMKYWSCCQRKTTEFQVGPFKSIESASSSLKPQEFMDQAGCETGNCKWVADKKGEGHQVFYHNSQQLMPFLCTFQNIHMAKLLEKGFFQKQKLSPVSFWRCFEYLIFREGG